MHLCLRHRSLNRHRQLLCHCSLMGEETNSLSVALFKAPQKFITSRIAGVCIDTFLGNVDKQGDDLVTRRRRYPIDFGIGCVVTLERLTGRYRRAHGDNNRLLVIWHRFSCASALLVRLYVVPVIYFRVPDGASLGPAHKCPQPRNEGIGALRSETAVLTLPQAKALLRTEYPLRIWSNRRSSTICLAQPD